MIIVDTSVWIEFLKHNSPIFYLLEALLENRQALGVEWIFGELLQGALNKKEREIIKSYWHNIPKGDEQGIWIEAGQYSSEHKLAARGVGLIDAAIVCAARKNNAQIWSLDKKLNRLLQAHELFAGA